MIKKIYQMIFPLSSFAILLDRDGTINIDTGYVKNPGETELEKNAPQGLLMLAKAGAKLVVISNQSGIGRGYYESSDLLLVNHRIDGLLQDYSKKINIYRYLICPHAPEDHCFCRKPNPGLIEQFMKNEDGLKPLVMIGDSISDLVLAKQLGIATILLKTGKGDKSLKELALPENQGIANYVAEDLMDAAKFILSKKFKANIKQARDTSSILLSLQNLIRKYKRSQTVREKKRGTRKSSNPAKPKSKESRGVEAKYTIGEKTKEPLASTEKPGKTKKANKPVQKRTSKKNSKSKAAAKSKKKESSS